ncbi:hypothetical protein RclHR1_02680003 [Rhizophagus clarus]|uniref:DUF7431 domain-containing protein n=1 Tax=Rhizophagus clarus TaxID=94130 RepID=A0A2Z6REU7_9GLOM|nr:hypothetical protein RclHR1_02680003 [Rhizophagus clarus]GES84879.1 hypothetical protein GLOIN_2v1731446 [Rhizophagus clarus]
MDKIEVVKTINVQQLYNEIDIVPTAKLSEFREKLEKTNQIDDKLSFSQKFDGDVVEISRGNEDDFKLEDIIGESSNVYLVNATTTCWKFLNKLHQLDKGWMINSKEIERVKERAFILQSANMNELDSREVTVSCVKVVKATDQYSFFISDSNDNFAGLLEIKNKNGSPSKFNVYEKACFEIDKLKPNKTFIDEVNDAIKDVIKDENFENFEEIAKKFEDITNKYGRFIPTKIIFGSREKNTKYCRNWDYIEFRDQKSIFQCVDASLREKIYSLFGKKILHSGITIESVERDDKGNKDDENINDNYKVKTLPSEVSKFISNNTDCTIFATAVGMNDYYHCQILTSPDKVPELIIHRLKEERNDRKILVGWMVVGHDTDLKSIFSKSKETKDMKLNVLRKNYIPYDESYNKMFELELDLPNHYCVGIPVLDKKDLLIGHYFSKEYKELRTFAYSFKEEKCVKLPAFSFDVLFIPKPERNDDEKKISDIPLEKKMITVENHYNKFKNFPKFISLYSEKSENEQILLNQQLTQIKVKFLNKNSSKISARDLKCSSFIPFESDSKPDEYYKDQEQDYLGRIQNAFSYFKKMFPTTRDIPPEAGQPIVRDIPSETGQPIARSIPIEVDTTGTRSIPIEVDTTGTRSITAGNREAEHTTSTRGIAVGKAKRKRCGCF